MQLQFGDDDTIMLHSVEQGGHAWRAGLRDGDRVMSWAGVVVDGKGKAGLGEAMLAMNSMKAYGITEVPLLVLRGSSPQPTSAVFSEPEHTTLGRSLDDAGRPAPALPPGASAAAALAAAGQSRRGGPPPPLPAGVGGTPPEVVADGPPEHVFRLQDKGTGFGVDIDDFDATNAMVVFAVTPGGAAELAGLAKADEITSMAGVDTRRKGMAGFQQAFGAANQLFAIGRTVEIRVRSPAVCRGAAVAITAFHHLSPPFASWYCVPTHTHTLPAPT